MSKGAYYSEWDPYCAQWLRNLIRDGHIAAGDVDTRSIVDVVASDLKSYTQCHFFAGIGVWSYALKQAGWSDERCVWTGSCPCQPFSNAGKRKGIEDERHLWPAWFQLIAWHRPLVVFGEQVASPDGLAWFDIVSSDLERSDYSARAFDLCAAGFGAPHIRQRLFFVADNNNRREGAGLHLREREPRQEMFGPVGDGEVSGVAYCDSDVRNESDPLTSGSACGSTAVKGPRSSSDSGNGSLGHADNARLERRVVGGDISGQGAIGPAGLVNGYWADAEWIPCSDGKWRPAKQGIYPLAYGSAGRVEQLRAYGNAVCAPVAIEFIKAYMECRP
jgi:DNA (cytosine-5)-methyltransferase 1